MTFQRLELVDLQASFPSREAPDLLAPIDLLIVVNGFEERTLQYVDLLGKAGAKVPHAVTLRFTTNPSENEANLADLLAGLQQIGASNSYVNVDEIELALPGAIAAVLGSVASDGLLRVVFDISGASGRAILRVVRTMFEMVRVGATDFDFRVGYTEARHYAPTKEQAELTLHRLRATPEQLSVGPDWDADEAGAIVEYIGQSSENVPERAVVICGFNADRVRVALDAVDPAFNSDFPHPGVTYIAGAPPSPAIAWRLDVMKEINSLGADPSAVDFTVVSTLEYMETLDALEAVYQTGFGNERLTLIPFGSKMQTLAAGLFCELHPDVRAELVAPARYSGGDYSTGRGPTHLLRFGALGQLAKVMSTLGSLRLVPPEGALTGWTSTSALPSQEEG